MRKLFARQGEILIFKVEKKRKITEEVREFVLRKGEVTGHKHLLVADRPETKLRIAKDKNGYYIEIEGGTATITHEEHKPITLNPGFYFVGVQREYDPERYRREVKD